MTPTTHPAIAKVIQLYDDGDESGKLIPFEPPAQALVDCVNAIRAADAAMLGDSIRRWGDHTEEHALVVIMLRRQTDQRLSAALGRYMEADKRRRDAMEEM
jgi:hypothetical protein